MPAFDQVGGLAQERLAFRIAGPDALFHELSQLGQRRLRLRYLSELVLTHGENSRIAGKTTAPLRRIDLSRTGERLGRLRPVPRPIQRDAQPIEVIPVGGR